MHIAVEYLLTHQKEMTTDYKQSFVFWIVLSTKSMVENSNLHLLHCNNFNFHFSMKIKV